jgi:predicted transcriptional regulator
MLAVMTPKDERRQAKIIVNARVDPDVVDKLDQIADAMRPRPSRSEMVDLAITEFVERHSAESKKKQR